MIHGSDVSIGCVAVGDVAIEELFVLVAKVGIERVEVVMCPSGEPASEVGAATPAWVVERYRELDARLRALGSPGVGSTLRERTNDHSAPETDPREQAAAGAR